MSGYRRLTQKRVSDSAEDITYTKELVGAWFGPSVFGRAQGYVDRVSDLRSIDGKLHARVDGTAHFPYLVEIVFRDGRPQGYCSCPVGRQCKHVAATLLAHLRQQKADSQENGLSYEVERWLSTFRRKVEQSEQARVKAAKPVTGASYCIVYLLTPSAMEDSPVELVLLKARLGVDGAVRAAEVWHPNYSPTGTPPRFVDQRDDAIVRAFRAERASNVEAYPLNGKKGSAIWQMMLETGRLFYAIDPRNPAFDAPMRPGASRRADIEWVPHKEEFVFPALKTQPESNVILATEPPWYIDIEQNETGIVDASIPDELIHDYLAMPLLTLREAEMVRAAMLEFAPALPVPPVEGAQPMRTLDARPRAVLTLDTLMLDVPRKLSAPATELDIARLEFDYGGVVINADSSDVLAKLPDGEVVRIHREGNLEAMWIDLLRMSGLKPLANGSYADGFFMPSRDDWTAFIDERVPFLREGGWRIVIAPNSRFDVAEVTEIDASAHATGDGWFDLELGIAVEGQPLRLEPLLAELFRRDRRWLSGGLGGIPDAEPIAFKTDTGRRFSLRADRLKPLVSTLLDLFEERPIDADVPLRLPALEAGRLNSKDPALRWTMTGNPARLDLVQRLRGTSGPRKVAMPRGLKARLRDYQRDGLNWMQFLREQNLAGVLADDMGLGKTVQTLAHIVVEKEAGRLDRPALIVVPTTLVNNWLDEARRFAPGLKVLDLHGPLRHERFAGIGEHELVVTTYPLVWRDHEALVQHDFHLLILDEAQYVKNASSKAAESIRTLRARHRLCLTGTPLENHLGELWSQFDFLLPGFLGSQKDFASRWRKPIEKLGDEARRTLLARRVRPFMLRRRKDEVAKELPAKTTILRTVELAGPQRDLYETVRAAMQKKVRDAISKQGFARSHILMLDALLKLRQVCCDPSLVRLAASKGIEESAKLELLSDMLPELIEEGRRVLVFSQFTGMLAIIAAMLDQAGLTYVMLTGDTADRKTPVQRFQAGEVPIFLISLKAGGVGLNLTAADTVIHYDPWWNPAAENQATDRAHRIGQDKPVFVYKLIVAGSIEEKIVAMQERKAALAAGILSEDAAASVKFSEEDIEALLAPMPETAKETKRAARRQRT